MRLVRNLGAGNSQKKPLHCGLSLAGNAPRNLTVEYKTQVGTQKLPLEFHNQLSPFNHKNQISNTHQKVFVQNAIRPRPAYFTILHKILQNLRQSFFRTHWVTLTENMKTDILCRLLTILLPRPPVEFVKHWNIIREPAGSKESRACNSCSAVDTTDGAKRAYWHGERSGPTAVRSRRPASRDRPLPAGGAPRHGWISCHSTK